MSGHLDGPPPGPPDPPYIPGDLGAPSAKEFARRRAGDRHMSEFRVVEANGDPYPPHAQPCRTLREAGERLAQAVAQVCGEGHPALGMWRAALAAADREAPDEAGRICCRGMGADGGCNICAAEATR